MTSFKEYLSIFLLLSHVLLEGLCRSQVSEQELSLLMQNLWNKDINRLTIGTDLKLNLQGQTYSSNTADRAQSRLFTFVTDLSKKSTYAKFISLLNNYKPLSHHYDTASSAEKLEQITFLTSIMGTDIWQQVRNFLINKGYVSGTQDLMNQLQSIWFREYSRANSVTGSSGFEHVFVGELNSDKSELSGLHNWIAVYLKEQRQDVDYQGYIYKDEKGYLFKLKLSQAGYIKYGNSMFIGTSPEFEMAIYTVCFMVKQNQQCSFKLNNQQLLIQTYSSYNGGLASAYPIL